MALPPRSEGTPKRPTQQMPQRAKTPPQPRMVPNRPGNHPPNPALEDSAGRRLEDVMQLQTLNDLFVEQLGDLYSAETQLVEALPKLAAAATNDKLRQAFEQHLGETHDHVQRLEEIFGQAGVIRSPETCMGMQGLIREGQEMITAQGDAAVRDAGLIAAAQRVEHYEIAAYVTVRTIADQLGFDDAK